MRIRCALNPHNAIRNLSSDVLEQYALELILRSHRHVKQASPGNWYGIWLCSHRSTQVSSSSLQAIMKGQILPSNKRMVKMASNEELLVQLRVGRRVVYHFASTFLSRYHQ